MNIGIDVDDVVYDTSAEVEKEIEAANNPILSEHKVQIMRGAVKELPEEAANFLKDTILSFTTKAKPMDDAIEILKKLKEDGHKIIFITARSNQIQEGVLDVTYKSFEKYGIEKGKVYDKIIFGGTNKSGVCESEKIDLFVDDSPQNCEIVKEAGFDVIAFKSRITADAIDKSGLPSVSSWNELYEMINK